ncbi:NlpC/P60 family protein [Streptomyces sp. NPDC057486]|uniref:NlpC/P60 family protein n=1 Tax=Streptomyces sp. NPDC057486 TaxID=3346145 RepID=UPI0036762FA5
MAQQTLLKPLRQTPEKTMEHRPPKASRSAPTSHRRPRSHSAGNSRTQSGDWRWVVVGLVVALVLSLLGGALLGVHGQSGAPSADPPAVTLQPESPATPEPAPQVPTPGPTQKPAGPGTAEAKPAGVKKVTVRPGDTLWALAHKHGTTVKALQKLNSLGTSTLIYAGDTLRVPSTAAEPRGGASHRPSPAPQKTGTPDKRHAKGGAAAVAFARAQLGKPYVWGGTGPRGFDCSGLVMRAWLAAGVKLPRTTWGQIHAGTATSRPRLVPGDLVLSYGAGHVGLYIGNGKVIHAPRPGSTVTIAPLPDRGKVVAYRHIHP